jgi:hypothetical protein
VLDDRFRVFADAEQQALSDVLQQCKLPASTRLLSLKGNALPNNSMATLANALTSNDFPKLEYLDLSDNQFDVLCWSSLETILKLESLKFVNICDNMIGLAESEKYFGSLSVNLFRKLIWIPEQRIDDKGWIVALSSELNALQDDIAKRHHTFFFNVAK